MTKIVLIGFMGTGKTEVGRLLAERLHLPFLDIDQMIEEEEGQTIAQIFGPNGENEAYFRRREREVIARVTQVKDCIIATGGGAVMDPENVRHLKEGGVVICLTAKPETILARIPDPTSRPMLKGLRGAALLARVRELQEQRDPFYRTAADVLIETTDRSVNEVVEALMTFLEQKGIGRPIRVRSVR